MIPFQIITAAGTARDAIAAIEDPPSVLSLTFFVHNQPTDDDHQPIRSLESPESARNAVCNPLHLSNLSSVNRQKQEQCTHALFFPFCRRHSHLSFSTTAAAQAAGSSLTNE